MKAKSMQILRDLYQTHIERFAQFVNTFPEEKLHGPLLLDPSAYFEQPIKLLVIGQETMGWHSKYDDIAAQLEAYCEFNVGETHRASPFWNVTRNVESRIGIQRYSCAWSNLNRFDHNGGAPKGKILEEVAKLDFLLQEEIQILKPDICLFYTNRKYDRRLEELYPGVQFHNVEGLPQSHFAQLAHADLPKRTFRTPHPKTMRLRKWEVDFYTFIERSKSIV